MKRLKVEYEYKINFYNDKQTIKKNSFNYTEQNENDK